MPCFRRPSHIWFLQKVYNLFCSKVTMTFVVKYATIVSRPRTILINVQKEILLFQYFLFFKLRLYSTSAEGL